MSASNIQRCLLVNLYLNWVVYLGGFVALVWLDRRALAVVWAIATPIIQWAYVRAFPRLSGALGYGSVVDEPSLTSMPAPTRHGPRAVTLYTAIGCPFCPLMEERLLALQSELGFPLRTIDVTARPDILARTRIRSVPVVEIAGVRHVGNLTSRQLAELIAASPVQ
jgi:glutaredoxin